MRQIVLKFADSILSDLQVNALNLLARRTQGKPTYIQNSNEEIWFLCFFDDNSQIEILRCLICGDDFSVNNSIKHARHHIKEHNLTAFL